MKYKVGDRVLIRSDLEDYKKYGAQTFVSSMKMYAGEILTISAVGTGFSGKSYRMKQTDVWMFTDEMIERKVEDNMFTKDDLKVGYVVEDSNKRLTMVADSDNGKYLLGRIVKIDDLYDDFKNKSSGLISVNKVYGFPENENDFLKITTEGRPLLWERKPEITELTFDEIAKKFNVSVETLRIKEK